MGPLPLDTGGTLTLSLTDARWNEKLAAGLLVAGIIAIGVAPFWLTDLVRPGTEMIMQKIAAALR